MPPILYSTYTQNADAVVDAHVRALLSAVLPISYNAAIGQFSMHVADATHDGYLSLGDWGIFNSKQPALGNFTTGAVLFGQGTSIPLFDAATLFWDNTAKAFCIGTSTQAGALTVLGAAGVGVGNAQTVASLTGGLGGSGATAGVGGGFNFTSGTGGIASAGVSGAGGTFTFTGGTGGANVTTNGPGKGGSFTFNGGPGGAQSTTSKAAGNGGDIFATSGAGGANSYRQAGGIGGVLVLRAGAGGNNTYSSTPGLVAAGGSGGYFYQYGGAGGTTASSVGASAGMGGGFGLFGGAGGSAVGTFGSGGNGGAFNIAAGAGGSATGAGIGGLGGSAYIAGGAGGAPNASGGDVRIYGGAKAGSGTDGNVYLASLRGLVGVKMVAPTAYLHIAAGGAAPNSAPLKLTAGTNLAAIEDGTFEFDGVNLFFSIAGVRHTIV